MKALENIHQKLRSCKACPEMCGTPVHGPAIKTSVMLIGQAPGPHEAKLGRPFAYTAGKKLFKWLNQSTGLLEEELRQKIYFAAVARCFPGKAKSGSGDRQPSPEEIKNCQTHLRAEFLALQPRIILAVGRLAISEVLGPSLFPKNAKLEHVVGQKFTIPYFGKKVDVIPLPHPSGVSRWTQTEPGKSRLESALRLIEV